MLGLIEYIIQLKLNSIRIIPFAESISFKNRADRIETINGAEKNTT